MALFACALIAGCAHVGAQEEGLPLLAGFRGPADQCRIVGENDDTNQFLGDASTLVGCPADYEGTGVFATGTGATRVGQAQGYVLDTVLRG